VLIGSFPAARKGDTLVCVGPTDTIAAGEPTVLIGNAPAARQGDQSAHGGVVVAGCPTVLIGSSAQGQSLALAAQRGAPFCEECEKRRAKLRAERAAKGQK
jgi:hypothetical protein